MSNIITFYSYKGGVGRSMAMANIALLLAKRGLRVLAVDWDLEAPGLERYFSYFKSKPSGDGLLNLLIDQYNKKEPDFNDYLWLISGNIEGHNFSLSLLPSGKETDTEYAAKLERFDWDAYFEEGGGDYVELLREKWLEAYDVTLIDSRTGLSDTGGICTIQLPDIVVAMFTANHQSLYGVRDIMRFAQIARNDLANDRMHLTVLPLPARFGSRVDSHESLEWLNLFAEVLGEFYQDWLPRWIEPRNVVKVLKIPQVDFFGFGEKLAVVEEKKSNTDGMGVVYDTVAKLLSHDLQDVETILNIERPSDKPINTHQVKSGHEADYEYEIYVSFAQNAVSNEWLQSFIIQLKDAIQRETGEEPRIFDDYSELSISELWAEQTKLRVLRTKLLLAVLTPQYFESRTCMRTWATFELREQITNDQLPLIIPLFIRGRDTMPSWVAKRQFFDMSDLPIHTSAFTDRTQSSKLIERIKRLAKTGAQMLYHVPSFDPQWTVFVPEDKPIYEPDFKYDIYISYSRNDNITIGNESGWVETFHTDLENWLVKRRGLSDLKIWRDTSNMQENDVIEGSIEDAVRQSRLLFALNSRNYIKAKYCKSERDLFDKYNREINRPLQLENSNRVFNIRINDIPHEKWLKTLGQTSGFEMFAKNGKDPIARSDANYLKLLSKIVDAVEEILEIFPKPVQYAEPRETNAVKIFVADVAPSLDEFRGRIITEAKTKKAVILEVIPDDLSFEAYKKNTEDALNSADFSVHLLDQYPGSNIPDQELTYPVAQCEIALSVKTPQLIWVPAELNIQAIEEKQQKDFLGNIAHGDRAVNRYEFIHSTKLDFIDILTQEIDKLQKTSTNGGLSTSFLIDTHQKDQLQAFELAKNLSNKGVRVEFNLESRLPIKSMEMFQAGLKNVKNLILVFGRVDPDWIKARIKSIMKTLASDETTALEAIWVFRTPGSKPIDLSEFSLFKINILDNSKTDTIDENILRQLLPGRSQA